jgi:hypothetical protein
MHSSRLQASFFAQTKLPCRNGLMRRWASLTMRTSDQLLLALLVYGTSQIAGASELERLFVDLDKDGISEVVSIKSERAREAHRADLRVAVGNGTYKTEYFAADGDWPEVRVVQLNRESGLKGLLVTTYEAGWCVHHLLTYVDETLHLIMKHDAGSSCRSLSIYGDSRFLTSTWEGFWFRTEMFKVRLDGKGVEPVPINEHAVNVPGYAGTRFELRGGDCEVTVVLPGTFLTIAKFDSLRSRYLVETPEGACGWIPNSDLTSQSPEIRGLPWAG